MPEPTPNRRRRTYQMIIIAVVVTVTGLAGLALLPRWLVWLDLYGQVVPDEQRRAAIGEMRGTLLQVAGGAVVALGAWATWRRLRINEEELRASRDGQITERYSRAIEHLGSDSIDVRMGGIYALERLARNSPTDHETIIAVLCAFVRGHAPWPPRLPEQLPEDTPPDELQSLATRANDVQAAVTVLGRLGGDPEGERIGVPHADLRWARLDGLRLPGASFAWGNLCRARLRGADLRGAMLRDANFQRATLQGADLREAVLDRSDLTDADARDADLRDSSLKRANLARADLSGSDLRGALLDGACLDGARADERTRWPEGFDPAAAGVLIRPTRSVHPLEQL